MSLFGFQVVARAIVECSVNAWWLVDPSASIDTRLARLYVDNLTNINEMTKVGRLPEDGENALEVRRNALVSRANSAGIEPLYDKKTNSKLVGFGDVASPIRTTIAGKFFEALGYELGEYWYRSLSAICHGTMYGLLDHYSMVAAPDPDITLLRASLSIDEVMHIAILSMQAYLGAIQFHSKLLGWNFEDVERRRADFFSQMLAVGPSE
jgi:hypothetical protein